MVSSGVGTLGHRYEVATLLTEVAPQEGLLQALDSLQSLDAAINDVFNRIQSRINDEKGKIAAVVNRVTRAQGKVAEIGANQSRVTTIFSTAKYPASKVLPDFKRIIDTDLSAPQGSNGVPPDQGGLFLAPVHTPHRIALKDRFAPAPPADTSVLYSSLTNARLLRAEHESAFNEEQEMAEGLGRLPSYLPSISSVLLFNSDENPYKQYVSINNLEGVGGQDRAQDAQGPSAAPKSLIDGLELPTYAGFTFEYKPLLGEMPTFDLPQNLPLGKLADITFGVDQSLSIAPSMATLSLPSLDMLALPMPSRPQQQSAVPQSGSSSVPAAPAAPSAPTSTPSSVPAPPAPPPPPANNVPAAPPPPAPGAPPPPPQGVPAAVAKPTGGRGALLDAIRDAKNAKRLKPVSRGPTGAGRPTGGRAGLKPAGARGGAKKEGEGEEDAPAKAPPPSDGGGDMMAALRERLARRQQAMSGKGEVDAPKSAAAPAMSRRVSVAPRLGAPPKPGAGPGAKPGVPKVGEEADGDPAPASDSKMSSAVLAAYMSSHAKKQEKEDDWE